MLKFQRFSQNSRYLFRWGIVAASILALLFLSLSLVDFSPFHNFKKEVSRMEKRLHERQDKLEALALNVLNTPLDERFKQEGLSEDMVLYQYYKDSLCFWENTLPIAHDDILYGQVIVDFMSRKPYSVESISQFPLLYLNVNINGNDKYLNLGNAWYVVKTYHKAPYTVITALLIQTDYPIANTFIKNGVNPHLHLRSHFSIVPANLDEGYLVFNKSKSSLLFSVLVDAQLYNQQSTMLFRWLSVLCVLLALFCTLKGFPKSRTLWIVLPLLGVLRLFCYFLEGQMMGSPIVSSMVSPLLYADANFSSSLANLLLNNIFIFFCVSAIIILRRSFSRFFYLLRETPFRSSRRLFWACLFAVIPILLIVYIHISLRSIVINSSIVMEILKISELSIYSILVYASFGLLFTSLYLLIGLGWPVWLKRGSRATLLLQRVLVSYIVLVSLYSLITVSIYGAHKERERNRVWTQKMAIERDPDTEILFRNIDLFIASDLLIKSYIQFDQSDDLIRDLIRDRLEDYFFPSLKNKYAVQATTCRPGGYLLMDDTPSPVNCYNYFHQIISAYGTQLYEDSHFYYLNNPNGRTSYMGIYNFKFDGGYRDLYIELDSHPVKDMIGYPELLRDQTNREISRIPFNYSFAKYVQGGLNAFSGNYIYPTQMKGNYPEGSFSVVKRGGYLHYINSFDANTVIVLSRPSNTLFLYVVSFSYLILFFGLIVFAIVRLPAKVFWKMTLNRSFRRKIMLLVVVSLVVALVFMGLGSVWFGVKLYNDNNRRAMEEKIATSQSMLQYSFRFLDGLERVDKAQLAEELTQFSRNVHIDINIYNTSGWLVQTSQPEMLEKYLMGRRMNSEAFKAMSDSHQLKFFHKEHIGNLDYYSVYAPLFNDKGKLIGYLNLPYFSRESDITNDLTSIVATIANIYILLLLAAILAGTAISNQLGRPLVEVAKKMQRLDLTKQREHIDYKGKNELGELIRTYNKMVDDVAEASQRMAQTEREQAWREMARQIAHEIKNPLTPMRLSLQHLIRLKRENVPDWPERFDGLAQTLIEQIDILSDSASELSSFSRFYSEEPTPVELNHLIREQCTLFSTGEAVKVSFISGVDPATVMGRKQQLSRVLVNLISNAKQALEGNPHGRVRLRLEQEDGHYALHVEDNGPGVTEKLQKRLFTPNFTTKSGGTGLGLAICRSIIEQSNGTISYTTSEWGGACFTIQLPAL